MKPMNKKTCPLFSIAGAVAGGNGPVPCQGESCAWYIPSLAPEYTPEPGYCAVHFLNALPDLER